MDNWIRRHLTRVYKGYVQIQVHEVKEEDNYHESYSSSSLENERRIQSPPQGLFEFKSTK